MNERFKIKVCKEKHERCERRVQIDREVGLFALMTWEIVGNANVCWLRRLESKHGVQTKNIRTFHEGVDHAQEEDELMNCTM